MYYLNIINMIACLVGLPFVAAEFRPYVIAHLILSSAAVVTYAVIKAREEA